MLAFRVASALCPIRLTIIPVCSTLPIERRYNAVRCYSSRISRTLGSCKTINRQSYIDYIQERIKEDDDNQSIKLPAVVTRMIQLVKSKVVRRDDDLHPELKFLLDKAASQLYYSCAENTRYLSLCEEFNLPDLFTTWFKLTLLHVWMILLRLHVSLDAASYQRFQHGILTTLWADVDKRVEIMQDFAKTKTTSSEMKQVHALYLQTFFEYDEGFLADDPTLASALWRNMYMEQSFQADEVLKVVRYIRATIAYLSEVDSDDILVNGVDKWKIAEELNAIHKK